MFLDIIESYTSNYKVILIDFLGHGKSDGLEEFPIDLWFDEAQQVISFLKEKKYNNVNLIGSSGGALVAINVALETPELVDKVIADSFEGEMSLKEFTKNVINKGYNMFLDYQVDMGYGYDMPFGSLKYNIKSIAGSSTNALESFTQFIMFSSILIFPSSTHLEVTLLEYTR